MAGSLAGLAATRVESAGLEKGEQLWLCYESFHEEIDLINNKAVVLATHACRSGTLNANPQLGVCNGLTIYVPSENILF